MAKSEQTVQAAARCTLCPAGCPLQVRAAGPDAWRSEYPLTEGQGVCPRGSTVAELLGHRSRIRTAAVREDGKLRPAGLEQAVEAALADLDGKGATLLLDGNLPCEQLTAAAAWCNAWPGARLCLVIEPADEQLLLGIEASGAKYLGGEALAECDGFLVVGDAFSANPTCARGVFDRRREVPRTPVVVLDPGAGTASKFATHRVATAPGMELAALSVVTATAGVDEKDAAQAAENASAGEAGRALADCKRLAVLVAAEYARSADWRQIGYLCGRLAKARGGGVAPQTAGANALAALRLRPKLKAVSLAEALAGDRSTWIAVGCDVLGTVGWGEGAIPAAAAPLPNATTAQARVVLPVAMAEEVGGTYLLAGEQECTVAPLMAPPAGVPEAAALVGMLAAAAGVSAPADKAVASLQRPTTKAPDAAAAAKPLASPVLLLGRQSMHAGAGALTGHGSWQRSVSAEPELRVSPPDARERRLRNFATVTVRVNGQSVQARVRVAPELGAGVIVLPEGMPETRALMPCVVDSNQDALVASAATAEVSV